MVFIFMKLRQSTYKIQDVLKLFEDRTNEEYGIMLFPFLLVPINWLLEARKWQLLINPIQQITLKQALQGVLVGLSLGFITPHSLGDYAGRIGLLEHTKRIQGIGSLMISRVAGLLPTLIFGAFGLWYMPQVMRTPLPNFYQFWTAVCGVFILLILIFHKFLLKKAKQDLKKWYSFISIIEQIPKSTIYQVAFLAFFRYLIFLMQLFSILYIFTHSFSVLDLLGGCTWIFLAKSILPTFNFLSDLGIRETAALAYFSAYPQESLPIVLSCFLIWIINILIPSMVGGSLIWNLKIKLWK